MENGYTLALILLLTMLIKKNKNLRFLYILKIFSYIMLRNNKYNNIADIKREYTNELVNLLYIPIYDGIKSIYDTSKTYFNNNRDELVSKQFGVLVVFQIFIRKIPMEYDNY